VCAALADGETTSKTELRSNRERKLLKAFGFGDFMGLAFRGMGFGVNRQTYNMFVGLQVELFRFS
jgi:hypothetical protein